ncbi:hypothetical protein EUTSA_v10019776mg, partial [Eutrema salsugineum]
LSHVFASVNRSVNFIDHTGDLAWKESQRIKPIVVDPALYLARRTQLFTATEKRPTPDAFKVFTGNRFSSLKYFLWLHSPPNVHNRFHSNEIGMCCWFVVSRRLAMDCTEQIFP